MFTMWVVAVAVLGAIPTTKSYAGEERQRDSKETRPDACATLHGRHYGSRPPGFIGRSSTAEAQRPKLNGPSSTAQAQRPKLNGPSSTAQAQRPKLNGPSSTAQAQRPKLNGPSSTALAQRPKLNGLGGPAAEWSSRGHRERSRPHRRGGAAPCSTRFGGERPKVSPPVRPWPRAWHLSGFPRWTGVRRARGGGGCGGRRRRSKHRHGARHADAAGCTVDLAVVAEGARRGERVREGGVRAEAIRRGRRAAR